MWMARASSPSSRSEPKTGNSRCASAIPAWGCPRSRRTRSSMHSLRRSFMEPVWDCPSAAPSLNRTTAACGPPTTLCAARVFTSFCPPRSRHETDAGRRSSRLSREVRGLSRLHALFANSATNDATERGQRLTLEAAREVSERVAMDVTGHESRSVCDRSTFSRRRRSEEHTSELQSHSDLVCRLLLEKKKKRQ